MHLGCAHLAHWVVVLGVHGGVLLNFESTGALVFVFGGIHLLFFVLGALIFDPAGPFILPRTLL